MTTIEEALFSKLTNESAITDLVGTRVYPLTLPQNPTYPAMTYQQISKVWGKTHQGAGDMGWPRFQFDCYGTSYSAAKGVANALRQTIDGFSGTVATVDVCAIFFVNEVDDFNDEVGVYRVAADYRVIYRE